MKDDVCESLGKFVPIMKSCILWEIAKLLQSLYSQLVEQNDFGPRARFKFVRDALNDKEAKQRLKRSITTFVNKEEVMYFFSVCF